MMEQIAEASPRLKARIAGALWLIIIVAAAFAEFYVRGRIVVDGDASATATNILAHETLYRLGAAAALIYLLCDIVVALILYELLKPVSRSLSLLASVFRLAMVGVLASNCGRSDDDNRVVLPDSQFREPPRPSIGGPFVELPYATRLPRRIIADPMAPRDRR
jgi:hypothetical protein